MGTWSPQNRYDAAGGKNATARPTAFIRATPRQDYLVHRPTVRRSLKMALMERLAFQQVVSDLVMRRPYMQDDYYYPPLSLMNLSFRPPYVSTVADKAVSAR